VAFTVIYVVNVAFDKRAVRESSALRAILRRVKSVLPPREGCIKAETGRTDERKAPS
jgi:hypothetical protein